MKARKSLSLHWMAVLSSFDEGFRFLPLLFVIHRGAPLESGIKPNRFVLKNITACIILFVHK